MSEDKNLNNSSEDVPEEDASSPSLPPSPLAGTVGQYIDPFEPAVDPDDWETLEEWDEINNQRLNQENLD